MALFNIVNALPVSGILTATQVSLIDANTNALPVAITTSNNIIAKYNAPCVAIDTLSIPIVNNINTIKQSIVTLCASASAGNPTACTLSSNTADVVSVYGNVAVGIATAPGNVVGLASTAVVAYGIINQDALNTTYYPNLENGVYTTDNPLDSPTTVGITTSNLGIGTNTALNYNSGPFIGYCFAIVGACGTITSAINTYVGQISTIRSGIITTYTSDATVIKGYRYKEQLNNWSLNKVVNTNNNLSINISSTISILNNPAYGGPY